MGTQRGVNGLFFCLPLLCVMIMESPSMPIAFLLEEEEIWDSETPPLGQVH